MASTTVELLKPNQLMSAAAALARAFHDDPLQTYCLPDPVERAKRSPAHFAPILAYGVRFGRVYTTQPDPFGAAIWLPPDGWKVTPERAAEVGLDRLGEALGESAAARFHSVLDFADSFHHQDVEPEHWYLFVLGIAPEAQGQGLARRLMEPILAEASARGVPSYLETTAPKNVAFYEHLGYKVMRHAVEPVSGIDVWTFRRGPT